MTLDAVFTSEGDGRVDEKGISAARRAVFRAAAGERHDGPRGRKAGLCEEICVCGEVNFGSIDTKFRLNGVDYATPDGVAHYLEHKMFDLPDGQRDGAVRAECWQQQRLYELCDDGLLRRVHGAVCGKSVYPAAAGGSDALLHRARVCGAGARASSAQEIRMYDDSDGQPWCMENLFAAGDVPAPSRRGCRLRGRWRAFRPSRPETLHELPPARSTTRPNLMLCVVGDVGVRRRSSSRQKTRRRRSRSGSRSATIARRSR